MYVCIYHVYVCLGMDFFSRESGEGQGIMCLGFNLQHWGVGREVIEVYSPRIYPIFISQQRER